MISFTWMELVELAGIVFTAWFCYRSGWNDGVQETLAYLVEEKIVKEADLPDE